MALSNEKLTNSLALLDTNAVQQNGLIQSDIEDILEDLIEFTECVLTKSRSGGGGGQTI